MDSTSASAEPPAVTPHPTPAQPTLVRGLTLLDSVLLLVSGIIGSSIFLTAKDIAGPLPQPMLFLLVWVIGGVISLFGCVAFAELGSMFPESGGQYVYLREAYGDLVAFLYGWMLFAVANGGSIAALSVASAAYTRRRRRSASINLRVRDFCGEVGNEEALHLLARQAPEPRQRALPHVRSGLGRISASALLLSHDARGNRTQVGHPARPPPEEYLAPA